jgi:hypothetical protein
LVVVAIPNHEFAPAEDALGLAGVVLRSLDQLRPEVLDELTGAGGQQNTNQRSGP